MLPKMLYELLPYIYLSVGVGGGVSIDSAIVFIAAISLMFTGLLVIYMRYSYRLSIKHHQYNHR